MGTTPKATTMLRCIQEAREFIRPAEEVPIKDFGMSFKGNRIQVIESGKASGLMKAQSIILTRALANYRQDRSKARRCQYSQRLPKVP
jgi:hypothetical protein